MASTLRRRYGCGEHGAVAGRRVPLRDTPTGGMYARPPNESAAGRKHGRSVACGCAEDVAASRDSWTEKPDIHAAVGTVARAAVCGPKLEGKLGEIATPLMKGTFEIGRGYSGLEQFILAGKATWSRRGRFLF